MKNKKRIPVIAAALSLVTPGLGQLYNGQILKGIIFFLAILLFPNILFLAGLPDQFLGLAAILIFIICLWLFIIVEAFFTAKRRKEVVLKGYNKWYVYLLIILLMYGTYYIPGHFTANFASDVLGFSAYRMPTGSMEPTLLIGDFIFKDSKYFKKNEAESYVVQGDVNFSVAIRDNFGPVTVPPSHCFVMGDNRDNSSDSRHWGSVPLRNIKAKPLYIYWAKDKSRIGKKLR